MPRLSRELTVMQVKQGYSEVYMYRPTLVITPKHLKNKRVFLDFLKGTSSNWKDGKYFFRSEEGTFAYFDLREGKINLRKMSNTGRKDLVWERLRSRN
ncbi:MAG: hypothetical protein AABW41_01910 [Nanoarchaeota archaeon]